MSSKKPADIVALCVNHCVYYKPGKNEELRCQGAVAVQGLIRGGRAVDLERPRDAAAPDRRTTEGLKARVCGRCAFREADCDFVLSNGSAAPCGGYALLSRLLGSGELTLDEIEKEGK